MVEVVSSQVVLLDTVYCTVYSVQCTPVLVYSWETHCSSTMEPNCNLWFPEDGGVMDGETVLSRWVVGCYKLLPINIPCDLMTIEEEKMILLVGLGSKFQDLKKPTINQKYGRLFIGCCLLLFGCTT